MNTLSDIYNHVKNQIKEKFETCPIIVYTGVGVAANTQGQIAPENYHQYPPFLQDMKNLVPNLKLFLVLIDPLLESPPLLVRDHPSLNETSPNVYVSADESIHVYGLRNRVFTDVDKPLLPFEHTPVPVPVPLDVAPLNITSDLRQMNHYAVNNRITTLYHDFSGRRNNLLAELFDAELLAQDLATHLDHIVYGFMLRADLGCYVDLTQAHACFPYTVQQDHDLRPMLTFCNIFKDLVTNTRSNLHTEQKKILAKQLQTDFINQGLAIFRLIKRGTCLADSFFESLPYPLQVQCAQLLSQGALDSLYDLVWTYYSRQLEYFVRVKEYDLTGSELLHFILKGDDPYKWANNFRDFL